jgi:TRAP-type transport system periplasmic protein
VKKIVVVLLGILILASLALSGCGGSQSAPTSAAPSGAAPAKTSTAPTTTAAPASSTTAAPSPASTQAAAPGKVIELRFSHHNSPQTWTSQQFLIPWAKKMETATNGALKITIYPAQAIATLAENYDATANGVADIGWMPTAAYAGRFPLSEVITLPFLSLSSGTLNGQKVVPAVVNSHMIQELYETVPEIQKEWSQTHVLFLHTSEPNFLISKKVVKTLDDMKGLKVAVLGSGPALDAWKRVGASPLYLGAPEVYDAASKGVVDAATANWASIGSNRFNEVFPNALDMAGDITIFAMVMNINTWNKLGPDLQKQVNTVCGIAGAEFAGNSAYGENTKNDVFNRMKATGKVMTINSIDPGEVEKVKALAAKPLWDDWTASLKAKGLASEKAMAELLKLEEKYK